MTTNSTIALHKWTASHSQLCQAEQAVFFFLATFAAGRQEFRASAEELLPLLGRCSRARFDYLTNCLVRHGLIAIEPQPSGSQHWKIKEHIDWAPAPLVPGERFSIPVSRARQKADAEWRAFCMAQKRCERLSVPFGYTDFADFMHRVGRRPEGKFCSGSPMFSLCKKNDLGEYEWRLTGRKLELVRPREK